VVYCGTHRGAPPGGCTVSAGPKVLYEFGPFRVDPDTQVLLRDGKPVPVTPKAFDTLLILIRNSREIVSKDELMKAVWPDAFVEESNLAQNVFVLRKALGDTPDDRRYIVTLPGRGYRFAMEVRTVLQDADDVVITSHSRSQVLVQQTEGPAHEVARPAVPGKRRRLRWIYLSGGLAAVILVVIATTVLRRTHSLPAGEIPSVLIGDFTNQTGDPVFDGTLRTALRLKLTESPYLNVVPEAGFQRAIKELRPVSGTPVGPTAAERVCGTLGATVVVRGEVLPGDQARYRIRLSTADCKNGRFLARQNAQASSRQDVLVALGHLVDDLRRKLGEPAASLEQFHTPIAEASTGSLAALKLFSTGEQRRAEGQDYETVSLYRMATDLDPGFALAYARLGTIYSNALEAEPSRQFFAKAFAMRDHTSERERLYITAHYYAATGELEKLREVYELWRQLYPRDLVPPNNLVDLYFSFGDLDKAVDAARDAVRLGPDHAFPYANLMEAYRRTGQFQDAKVYNEVMARKLDGVVVHVQRYILAFAENDTPEMQHQLDWAKGNPQEGELLNAAGVAAMGRGQMRLAKTLFANAGQVALKNGLPQFAANCDQEYAEFAADVGLSAEAQASINRVLRSQPNSREFLASAALVFANSGDLVRAGEYARRAEQQSGSDFGMKRILLPTARAAAALQRSDPAAAVRELKDVEPYDLSWMTELAPAYYRGIAYLQLKRPADAQKQFQKVLDHWAARPEAAYIPLSHLALARSDMLLDDRVAARMEYEKFFALWKDADPDIPVLRRARAEHARVR
jgi:eukaryotic-like serine/threonine-protein kinase